MLSQEELKLYLRYCPDTGVFTWLLSRGRVRVGCEAGSNNAGRVDIKISGKHYRAHRLAFLYMTGSTPQYVDHINGNPKDNRWSNLRACTLSQNQGNRRVSKRSGTGVKGVYNTGYNTYSARITHRGFRKHVGCYDTVDEAKSAYLAAARELFGEFSSDGARRSGPETVTSF